MSLSLRPGQEAWDSALAALLARWHEATAPTAGLDPAARSLVDRLGRTGEARRAGTLETIRRALASLPLDEIDPSWLVAVIPGDPLLRFWSLALLPAPSRLAVAALLPSEPAAPSGPAWRFLPAPPAWYARFWETELTRALPLALPRPGGGVEGGW